MLDKELHLDLIRKTLSKGGEYADIFTEVRKQTSLVMDDGKLEKVIRGFEAGVGIRLIYKGRTSYAYSNDFSEAALMKAAAEAGRAAAGGQCPSTLDLRRRRPSVAFDIKLMPEGVSLSRKISVIRAADNTARNFSPQIKQVSAVYRDLVQKVQIATSDGFISEDERIYTSAIVHVVAVSGNVIQTGYESAGGFIGFELFEEDDMNKLTLKAARRAVMMLSAPRAPGGRMPVAILSSAGGTMIHEAIGHGLEADLAQQGLSVYSGKAGSRVASPLVTVIDDSTLPGKRGSFRFDDEGSPSRETVLVEKGVLKNYMYDRLTAMKDGAESTGNGRRESYIHRPVPRMSNTFIARGNTPPEKIIGSLEKGLLVEKMGGGQVNTVTGDFVFDVQEGYVIEKGLKKELVRGATLTGNGPQILQSIDMVGNDQGFSIGTCGKDGQGVPVSDAMPTIRIPEIVVGGVYA
ncbi:MAG: TldD/PmbA family protein [Candidatus Sulfobium sp.]